MLIMLGKYLLEYLPEYEKSLSPSIMRALSYQVVIIPNRFR
jgi:hypothetical protein